MSAYDIYSTRNTSDEYDIVVAPDQGAVERANMVAKLLGIPCVEAIKARDPNTGEITSIEIGACSIRGARMLIVDDICDGGGTFIALLDSITPYKPKSVPLYVAQGIFSKGLDILHRAGIEKVITTNSLCTLEQQRASGGFLEVIKI